MDDLVSTEWLAAELGAPDLLVLDATLFLPAHGRDARAEFEAEHVPGALFMDLARFSPLPERERLRAMLADLGVREGVRAVVYNDSPLRSAARGWWLIRHAGFEAAVLDGGLAKWREPNPPRDGEGDHAQHGGGGSPPAPMPDEHAPNSEPPPPLPTAAVPSIGLTMPRMVKGRPGDDSTRCSVPGRMKKEQLLTSDLPIADARSPARFRGDEPEPRAGVAPGHIPGARNLPYSELFAPDGTYKRGEDLRAAFAAAGLDPSRPFIATCGSGVTAACLVLAARLLGQDDVRLYDGSWAEWGADASTPKAVGSA